MSLSDITGGCVKYALDKLAELQHIPQADHITIQDLQDGADQAKSCYIASVTNPKYRRLCDEFFATADGTGFCNAAVKHALQIHLGHGKYVFDTLSEIAVLSEIEGKTGTMVGSCTYRV